ncbi:MAG: DUF1343 domain-containing protein [Candidatus Muirbacterium halophilum]|nr:DUF1343 domain-containing protein [Candidatus Muirbacterium halophilum]MCK9474388.1 DUF1343 domain-containing protein [Candidatus Muirbacterium halophilum]
MLNGIDVLLLKKSHFIKDIPLAIFTSYNMYDCNGERVIDNFFNPNYNLKYIIEPSFGFFINKDENLTEYNKIPILPAFSEETYKKLLKVKVILFDIQNYGVKNTDVIKALYEIIEFINGKDIQLYILDRPNPINGNIFDGIIGQYSRINIPLRHGLTIGEIGLFLQEELFREAKINVIKMEGYNREKFLDDIKPVFEFQFPDIKDYNAFFLYPGFHLLEGTNLSIGIGTEKSYSVFGAPWIDSDNVFDQIIYLGMEGFEMETCEFIPENGVYSNKLCKGIQFKVINKELLNSIELFLNIIEICYNTFGEFEFVMNNRDNYVIDELFSDDRIRKSLERYIPLSEVYYKAMKTLDEYTGKREKLLLY